MIFDDHVKSSSESLANPASDETTAETVGVPVTRFKVLAFAASTVIPGMVGGLMALRSTYFEVLLPHTTPAEAVQTALRIRKTVEAMEVRHGDYVRRVTVSIGIDCYDGSTMTTTPEDLRRRANKALHEAKRQGKDRAWLFADGPANEQSGGNAG